MTYDLDNYANEPPTTTPSRDPEEGQPTPHHRPTNPKQRSCMSILELFLAAVVIVTVVVGLAREFRPDNDPTGEISEDDL